LRYSSGAQLEMLLRSLATKIVKLRADRLVSITNLVLLRIFTFSHHVIMVVYNITYHTLYFRSLGVLFQ